MATGYIVAGLCWVLATDILLYQLVDDSVLVSRFETAKGWTFVLLGGLLVYLLTLRKSSQLERMQRLTATIIDAIGDGLLILGPDRRIAHANPAALKMLRCDLKDLIGMGARDFSRRFRVSYPTGSLVPPKDYVSQRVFEESSPLRYKAVLHPNGKEDLVILATAAGVRIGVAPEVAWVVSVMHDVTDSDQRERLQNRFFAAAAHCLKTPVATVKANAQLLAQMVSPEPRSVVNAITRQCDRIDRLIQNLLVLTRAHSNTLEIHPVAINLKPLVERIACEPGWAHQHQVHASVAGAPRVYADDERLALVLRNLLYEACRLSLAGSPIKVLAHAEGQVRVGVCYLPHDAWCESEALYDEYDDIGIERSVVDTIIEAHGGSVERKTGSSCVTWVSLLEAPPEASYGTT